MISSTTLKVLLDAGQSNEWLLAVTAAFDADMERVRELLREQFRTVDAGEPTPAALRMRKIRENKRLLKEQEALKDCVTDANTVREPCVTSYNILSLSKGIEKEESKPVVIARGRKQYSELFEKFWSLFPTDKGMSKLEAWKQWEILGRNHAQDDWQAAIDGIPDFKKWAAEQGPNYRMVHACRYLSQRRFDGFRSETGIPVSEQNQGFYVMSGTDAWDAWEAHLLKTKGRKSPRDFKGGWWFKTEYPPTQNEQAA